MKIFMCKGVVIQEKGRDDFKDGFLLLIICAFARGKKISDATLNLNLESPTDG